MYPQHSYLRKKVYILKLGKNVFYWTEELLVEGNNLVKKYIKTNQINL